MSRDPSMGRIYMAGLRLGMAMCTCGVPGGDTMAPSAKSGYANFQFRRTPADFCPVHGPVQFG